MNKIFKIIVFSFVLLVSPILFTLSFAEDLKTIKLPDPMPQFNKYKDNLGTLLKNRASTKGEYSSKKLSLADISAILWAAYGLNRPAEQKHTIPQSLGRDSMFVYLVNDEGVWLYNPKEHTLIQQHTEDVRKRYTDHKSNDSPITLAYTYNTDVLNNPNTGALHAGSMYQNVALYCAAANLANVVLDTVSFAEVPENQRLLILQNIGIKK